MARRSGKRSPGWLDLFSQLPWWVCVALAIVCFVLLHWIAGMRPDPKKLEAQPALYFAGTFIWILAFVGQFLLPVVFVVAAFISSDREFYAHRIIQHDPADSPARSQPGGAIDTSRWNLALLKALEWKRFELVCAGYFEELGFRAETTRAGPDGGVDIHLFTKESRHPAIVVQCKAWRNVPVGVSLVRELLGVMTAANVKEGIVATVGTFTSEAKTFALGKDIHLIDGEDFIAKLRDLSPARQTSLLAFATEGDFTTPTCPSCGIGNRMKLRTSGKDGARFWGCGNFPRCRTTMQLATYESRA